MSQKLTTSKVRLSYVNVFKPKETKQGDLKYSVTCLLPKSDVKGYKMLMDTINAEFEAEKNGKLKGIASPSAQSIGSLITALISSTVIALSHSSTTSSWICITTGLSWYFLSNLTSKSAKQSLAIA